MPLVEAAAYLHLDESTIRKGQAGTSGFAKVYQGRRVYLIRSQVATHKRKMIQASLVRQARLDELARRGEPSQNGFE